MKKILPILFVIALPIVGIYAIGLKEMQETEAVSLPTSYFECYDAQSYGNGYSCLTVSQVENGMSKDSYLVKGEIVPIHSTESDKECLTYQDVINSSKDVRGNGKSATYLKQILIASGQVLRDLGISRFCADPGPITKTGDIYHLSYKIIMDGKYQGKSESVITQDSDLLSLREYTEDPDISNLMPLVELQLLEKNINNFNRRMGW